MTGGDRLLSRGAADPVHAPGTNEISMLDLALLIRDVSGAQSSVLFTPLPQENPRRQCLEVSRALRVLGWAPRVTLRERPAVTIEWHGRRAEKPVPG